MNKILDTSKIISVIIAICFLIISCHWQKKKGNADNIQEKSKDTIHLITLIKSYEPQMYKGKVPKQYYDNRGAFDFWRYPLVFPYSIGCIDMRDYGNIYSDKDKTDYDAGGGMQPLTDYFDKFTFDKYYFVAAKCRSPFDHDTVKVIDQYFIFSFANGTSKNINGIDNLRKKLKEIKFSSNIRFMTIREYDQKL